MSDGLEALRARLEELASKLDVERQTQTLTFAATHEYVDKLAKDIELRTRELAMREADIAGYEARCRAARHHDVKCLVLKEIVRNAERGDPLGDWDYDGIYEAVKTAEEFADQAYSPLVKP